MRIGSLAVRAAAFFVGVAEAVSGSVGKQVGAERQRPRGQGRPWCGAVGGAEAVAWELGIRNFHNSSFLIPNSTTPLVGDAPWAFSAGAVHGFLYCKPLCRTLGRVSGLTAGG